MADVLRWGRTAYETDVALDLERDAARKLGLTWRLREDRSTPGDLRGVQALVVPSKVHVSQAVVDEFDGQLILTTTSGYDHIDVAACRSSGIATARCPLARRDAVVEQALALGASLMRRVPSLRMHAEQGRWARGDLDALSPRGLSGATVAVVGLGVIGQRMAQVLDALGARVLGVDPHCSVPQLTQTSLQEALERSDLVTLHCALTPSTRGLLNDDNLRRMHRHAVVVNTARGPLVDVDCAVAMVESDHLRGFACDVFPQEPYPNLARNSRHPGVVLTPHSAGYTHDLGLRVAHEVSANLTAWRTGEPLPGAIG